MFQQQCVLHLSGRSKRSIQDIFFSPNGLSASDFSQTHSLLPLFAFFLKFFSGQERENVAEILYSGAHKVVKVIISMCST